MNISEWIQVAILALIQGLSEFLPISSSAHLILPAQLWNWEDQGLAFDVGVHLGTLLAVIVYFWQDIKHMFIAWVASIRGQHSPESALSWLVILGTLPAVIAGALLVGLIETWGRSMLVIAATTLLFAGVMAWADIKRSEHRTLSRIGVKDAVWIGLAQAMAIIPGTSRSGATITMALLLGFDRASAARFSFLLSIPVIVGACVMMTSRIASGESVMPLNMLLAGAIIAAISAWTCIHLFLKWIDRIGMMPFVIYRVLLGLVLLFVYFNLPAAS